jgi:hypothetical protein
VQVAQPANTAFPADWCRAHLNKPALKLAKTFISNHLP